MRHFSERLQTLNGSFTFYFNGDELSDNMLMVSVADHYKTHIFYLLKFNGAWIISPKENNPSWINSLEETLQKLVIEKFMQTATAV